MTIHCLRDWWPEAWCGIVNSDDPRHLQQHRAKIKKIVQPVEDASRVTGYMAKYISKAPESSEWKNPGRWWGKLNENKVKEFQFLHVYRLTREQWYRVRRIMRKIAPKRVRRSRTARGSQTWWTFDRLPSGVPSSPNVGYQCRRMRLLERILEFVTMGERQPLTEFGEWAKHSERKVRACVMA